MVPLFFASVLFGCADNNDGSKATIRITDRTWGGACVDASQGSHNGLELHLFPLASQLWCRLNINPDCVIPSALFLGPA